MNNSPVTLIQPGSVATIRPLTATTGEVLDVAGQGFNFALGDVVSLPEWFITAVPLDEKYKGMDYWQAASQPNPTNPNGETVVVPDQLENMDFWDKT